MQGVRSGAAARRPRGVPGHHFTRPTCKRPDRLPVRLKSGPIACAARGAQCLQTAAAVTRAVALMAGIFIRRRSGGGGAQWLRLAQRASSTPAERHCICSSRCQLGRRRNPREQSSMAFLGIQETALCMYARQSRCSSECETMMIIAVLGNVSYYYFRTLHAKTTIRNFGFMNSPLFRQGQS